MNRHFQSKIIAKIASIKFTILETKPKSGFLIEVSCFAKNKAFAIKQNTPTKNEKTKITGFLLGKSNHCNLRGIYFSTS